MNQLETWLMDNPVVRHSLLFSSSLGYGWEECSINQLFSSSVTSLGNLPRLRGAVIAEPM